jgi:hypothetical protein
VFFNCWSIYDSRKALLGKEVLILSGKNLVILTSTKEFNIINMSYVYGRNPRY